MDIRLGQTEEGNEVSLDIDKFFQERLLIQGISGSWKSSTADEIMKQLKLFYKSDAEFGLQQIKN